MKQGGAKVALRSPRAPLAARPSLYEKFRLPQHMLRDWGQALGDAYRGQAGELKLDLIPRARDS